MGDDPALKTFCATELEPLAGKHTNWPRRLNAQSAALGLCSMYLPTQSGGTGWSFERVADVFETLGTTDADIALGWSVHNAGTYAICHYGSAELCEQWADDLCAGKKMAGFSLTEPQGGSDPANMQTLADPLPGGGYRVSGRKAWVSLAGEAEVFATVVQTRPDGGPKSKAMLAIPGDAPGVSFGPRYDLPGISAVPIADMILEDVEIPVSGILRPAGQGLPAALAGIDIARLCIAGACCGLIAAALDKALAHATSRELYGSPQVMLDGVQWMLGDIATDLELARLITRRAAKAMGSPEATLRVAQAKLVAPEQALRATQTATQLLGGTGLRAETGLTRLSQIAQVFRIIDGASEVQRKIIGRSFMQGATRKG